MNDELLGLILNDPARTDVDYPEAKVNTGTIGGGSGGLLALIFSVVGLGWLFSFFTDLITWLFS